MRKNRNEKGRRLLELVSNPHSKGEDFSRLILIFFAKISEINNTTDVIKKTIGIKKNNWSTIFSSTGPFDWKSNILIY